MAGKPLDIIARLKFEASEAELNDANQALAAMDAQVRELTARLSRLNVARQAAAATAKETKNVKILRDANREYEKTRWELKEIQAEHEKQLATVARLTTNAQKMQQALAGAKGREEAKRLNKELENTTKELAAAQTQGLKFGNVLSAIGVGLSAAFAVQKVKDFFADAVSEFEQAEGAAGVLQVTLRNFGREAYFDDLNDAAQRLADTFAYLDSDVLVAAETKLLTYGKVSISQVKELLPVIVDFAANQAVTIEEATETMIRGLEGQGRAFKQIGVNFKDGASTAENYKKIVTDVFDKVKGSAEDFAGSTTGRLQSMNQELANVKEELGKEFVPVFLNAKDSIKDFALAIGNFFIFLVKNRGLVLTFIGLWGAWKVAVMAANIQTAINTQGTVANVVATRLNTAAKGLNTAAQVAWNVAVGAGNIIAKIYNSTLIVLTTVYDVLTRRTTVARAAMLLFGGSLQVVSLAAVGILGVFGLVAAALVLFSNRAGAAIQKSREMIAAINNEREIRKRAAEATVEQETKLRLLLKVAGDDKKSIEERTKALDAAKDSAGGYLDKLSLQNIKTQEGVEIIGRYIAKIQELARAQAVFDLIVEKEKELLKLKDEGLTDAASALADEAAIMAASPSSGAGLKAMRAIRGFFGGKGTGSDQLKQWKEDVDNLEASLKNLYERADDMGTKAVPGADETLTPETETKEKDKADARFALEQELQKKITELQKKEEQLRAQEGERVTSESIRRRIEAERDAELKQLDLQEAAARRAGTITTKAALMFEEIRRRIRSNALLQYEKENAAFLKKLEADQRAFATNLLKIELQLAQDRAKLARDTLAGRLALIDKETEIATREAEAQFDALIEQAKALGLPIEQIEIDRQQRLYLIQKEGQRRRIEAEVDFLAAQNDLARANLEIQIKETEVALAQQRQTLEADYRARRISFIQYRRELRRIELEANAVTLEAQRLTYTKELEQLQRQLAKLVALRAAQIGGLITDADLTKLRARIAEVQKLLASLGDGMTDNPVDTGSYQKAEESPRVKALLSEMQFYHDLVSTAANAAGQLYQIDQERTAQIIEQQRRRVEAVKDIAAQGNAELLRKEEDRLAKLEAAQRKYATTQRALQAALIVSQQALNAAQAIGAVVNAAATGDPYSTAARVAAAVIAVAAGIAGSIAAVRSIEINPNSGAGFFVGGYTGDGNPHEVAGVVHKKEVVFDHKATARIGKDNLEGIRTGKIQLIPIGKTALMVPRQREAAPVNYSEMIKAAGVLNESRQQPGAAPDMRKLEEKMDRVTEAIKNIPGVKFKLDKDGFAANVWGAIEYQQKMRNL